MTTNLVNVRNIGIAAHIDAGKTTTTERILFYAGRTHRMGDVDDGTTTTDFDEQEQRRGITIYSAAVSCPWRGRTINLMDTPGHVDFTAEVERALRVLDGMVAVFDAKEGVEPQSETVWRQADKYGVPRLCFVNKMDCVGADFEQCVASIRERLHASPVVLQIPIGAADTFKGLIDLIEMQAVYYKREALGSSFEVAEIPADLSDIAEQYRHTLLETVAEQSEPLMDKYLHDEPLTALEIRAALRDATIRRTLTPVLCGSSLRYIGVQRMLDAVCDFLPSPLDVPPVEAKDARRPDVLRTLPCTTDGMPVALVFKIIADKPMDLYFLRLYAGTLKSNSRLINANTGEKENVSRIYRMFAKRRDQLDEAVAGDIVAVIGPRHALTGHSLCGQGRAVILETIDFPETVMSVAVEPRSSRDRDKLFEALRMLQRQDPTVKVAINEETGQTLVSGMGELHVEILIQRIKNEMNVDVAVGKPRVTYRETVSAVGEVEGIFDRQLGGREHFAAIRLRLEPLGEGGGSSSFEIACEASPEQLSPEYVEAAKEGIRGAAQSGILGGYPVINWRATILGGVQRDQASSDMAFESAGRVAFDQAMRAANPVLLQPIMSVQITTPEAYLGAIMGDLNTRRAIVSNTEMKGADRVIAAEVPLAQMFGHVTQLRSLSQGRASSTMTPSRYAPVPPAEMKMLVG